MATIWQTVLNLPSEFTATLFDAPICAIHSRSAEIVISRPTITSAITAFRRINCTSTSSAAVTISLSATGSRNAPNADVWFELAREKAVEPVGERGEHEDDHREQVAMLRAHHHVGQVEDAHDERNQHDSQPCQENR